MGAAVALSWYFLLAPIYLESQETAPGKVVNLAYAALDLALLFGLVLTFLPHQGTRCQEERAALLVLTCAVVLLIVGDSWYAWLNLLHRYTPAAPPALFWLLASLLAPLAGLLQLRLSRHQTVSHLEAGRAWQASQPERGNAFDEAARILLPLLVALLACTAIALRAILAPVRPIAPLIPSLVIFGLLLLVLMRQGMMVLEHAQLQRK